MPGAEAPSPSPTTDSRGWAWLIALVLALAAARLVYLALLCPYGLVEDEAQYWDWSRHLALSYYTKGPGVAWTIAASTRLLGDSEWAVRLMGPVSSAVLMLAAGALARRLSGSWRVGLIAALATQAAPILAATALLGTIDGPYAACWAVAAWAAWAALTRQSGPAWLTLGLALGLGFLYKYTILLLIPGLLLFAFTARPSLALPRRAGLWIALGVAVFLAASAPVILWNQQQGWPTVRHLLGHLGFAEPGSPAAALPRPAPGPRPPWSPKGLAEFTGAQFALVGPLLVLGGWAAWHAWRARRLTPRDAGRWYLAACGVPILVFYLLVAVVAEPEGNWALGGYVTWLPLAGWAAVDGLAERARRRRDPAWAGRRTETFGQVLWHWGVGYGLVAAVLMLRIDLLAAVPGVGRFVPVGRLAQGPTLAAAVESARDALARERGGGPLVIAAHYGPASQLAFYLPGRPVTFCTQSRFGGRPTNHDYWPATDLDRPDLRGRDAILVGGGLDQWSVIFARVDDLGVLPGLERRGVHFFRGLEYRGFGPPSAP